jgi:Putative transposase
VFRRLFLEGLTAAFDAGELQFFADLIGLNEAKSFGAALATLRTTEWVVYSKRPFAGPQQVLAYLARYRHRVAIANSRLFDLDETHVSFRWNDHQEGGDRKNKVMRLEITEFIRRFLLHLLPNGFHRIRHYGFLANGHRADKLALCRSLLGVATPPMDRNREELEENLGATKDDMSSCTCCGGRMKFISAFEGPLSRPYHARKMDDL